MKSVGRIVCLLLIFSFIATAAPGTAASALAESVGYYAYRQSASGNDPVFTDDPVDDPTDDPAEDSDDTTDESADAYPPERNWQSGTLPPSGGRRVVPERSFSVDLHYNPNVIFHGRFYVEATSVSRYINALGTLQERYPETIRVFNLLVPSHVEFLPERYSADVAKQRGPIDNINYWLGARGVIPVEAYDILAERASTEYLYFRTDHHWTALGAYYAYIAFTRAAGLEPINIYNYTEFAIPNFIGSYVTNTPSRAVLNSPDTLYYYRLNNGTTFSRSLFSRASGGYRLFLGGDHDLLDFTSSNKNGRTLIVIKDSYANAFIPWAAPHYERIVVIDPRHYKGGISRFLRNSAEADVDVLFLSSANTPSYPGYVSSMARITGA